MIDWSALSFQNRPRCISEMTITLLQRLGWIINFEKSDLTPSQDFQFLGMHFNTWQFTVAPLPKMCLKVQSVHQHWMPNLSSQPVICTGCWAWWCLWQRWYDVDDYVSHQSSGGPPQHAARGQELDRKDLSSSVGHAGSGMVGISSSPARSSPRHTGNGSHALHRCVRLWLGSPTRLKARYRDSGQPL